MRAMTEAEIIEVVDGLQGTCMSIDQVINMYISDEDIQGIDDITNEDELNSAIDNAIFECADCGWWCEVGDYAENQTNVNGDICGDCEPEEDD